MDPSPRTNVNSPAECRACGEGSSYMNCGVHGFKEDEAAAAALRPTEAASLTGDHVVLPHHYTRFPIEPIKFITENGLDFCTGNVIKYVVRGPHKNGVEDLKKARRYLDMMIARAEGNPDWNK